MPDMEASPAPSVSAQVIDQLLALIDRLAKAVIVVAMAVMVAVVTAQVALRYATSGSIGWADEISRLAFVTSIFLAIPLGIRIGAHIGVELLTARLPLQARAGLARLMAAASVGLMLTVAYQAFRVAIDQWDEKMASLEFSAGWFLLPVAFGALHAALHLMRLVVIGPYPRHQQVAAIE
jgi:TRAP-type transport system small permease protein